MSNHLLVAPEHLQLLTLTVFWTCKPGTQPETKHVKLVRGLLIILLKILLDCFAGGLLSENCATLDGMLLSFWTREFGLSISHSCVSAVSMPVNQELLKMAADKLRTILKLSLFGFDVVIDPKGRVGMT